MGNEQSIMNQPSLDYFISYATVGPEKIYSSMTLHVGHYENHVG